jgi:hypothetical protein
MTQSHPTKYLQLVRAESVSEDRSVLHVVAIGWRSADEGNTAAVPMSDLPEDVAQLVAEGEFPIWLLCLMNLGAESAAELDMTNFRIAPEPDPADGPP